MRELDRLDAFDTPARPPADAGPSRIGVVGAGRVGTAIADALRAAGCEVDGPSGRDAVPRGEAILLCVPDGEIASAAAAVAGAAPLVGHTSGATPLAALEPAARAGADLFGLHPLQTFAGDVTSPDRTARLLGAGCAIAGSTPAALAAAEALARRLGMEPFELDDDRRAAYHAAASVASNFLLTLQATAEQLALAAGLARTDARRLLAPLVRSTVESWVALGPERALTGPIARGDAATVAAQRAAVEATDPGLLLLFDALAERTRALAGGSARSSATATPVPTEPPQPDTLVEAEAA